MEEDTRSVSSPPRRAAVSVAALSLMCVMAAGDAYYVVILYVLLEKIKHIKTSGSRQQNCR